MDLRVRCHGMKAKAIGYLWSKYECFLTTAALLLIKHLKQAARLSSLGLDGLRLTVMRLENLFMILRIHSENQPFNFINKKDSAIKLCKKLYLWDIMEKSTLVLY